MKTGDSGKTTSVNPILESFQTGSPGSTGVLSQIDGKSFSDFCKLCHYANSSVELKAQNIDYLMSLEYNRSEVCRLEKEVKRLEWVAADYRADWTYEYRRAEFAELEISFDSPYFSRGTSQAQYTSPSPTGKFSVIVIYFLKI